MVKRLLAPVLLANTYPVLHGIRVLAMILVTFFHVGERSIDLTQFWFVMDAVFVLSGFLIGLILMHSIGKGGGGILRFYFRRAFRTFPAYYVVLTGAVLAFGVTEGQKATLLGDYLYLTNYNINAPHIMQWAWSLCVEEHFYLLFPLFIMLLKRVQDHQHRLLALGGLCAVTLLYRAVAYAVLPKPLSAADFDAFFYYPTHARVDQFAFGLTLGYVWFHFQPQVVDFCVKPAVQKALLGILAVSFGTLVLSRRAFQPQYPIGSALMVVFSPTVSCFFYGSLLLYLMTAKSWVVRLFSHHWVYVAASFSYGVYLVHFYVYRGIVAPFFTGTGAGSYDGWFSPRRWLAFALTLAFSFVLSFVIHILVEKPLLTLRDRLTAR